MAGAGGAGGRRAAGITALASVLLAGGFGAGLPAQASPASAGTRAAEVTLATSPVLRPRTVRVPAKRATAPRRPGPGTLDRVTRLRLSTLGSGTVGQATPQAAPRVGVHPGVLPTFTAAYQVGTATYRLRMVGTDPAGPAVSTVVPTGLQPVGLRIGGETVAPAPAALAAVASSGLFTPRALPGGTGQYGDVFVRTQFWSLLDGGSKAWHVLLGAPQLDAALNLDVPAGHGVLRTVHGVRTAFVDVDWLDAALQPAVLTARADRLTQFVAGNVVGCAPLTADLSGCGVGGYHSSTTDGAGAHTYSYQAFLAPAVFGAGSGFSDLGPMSHELAEWMADPYVDNAVPPWTSSLAPQYGCVDALEPGDPVVGRFLSIGGLTYQDEAYLSWFLRQAPSSSWQGRYTWLDSFATFSDSCSP